MLSLAILRHAALAQLRCAPGVCSRLLSSEPGEQVISIDRSGLGRLAEHSHGEAAGAPPVEKEAETEMARHIKSLIRVRELDVSKKASVVVLWAREPGQPGHPL